MVESFYYAKENTICKLIIGSPSVPFCQKCRAEYVTSVLHWEGEIRCCSLQTWCILLKFGVHKVIVILTVMLMFWVNLSSQYNFKISETSWLYSVFLLSDMFLFLLKSDLEVTICENVCGPDWVICYDLRGEVIFLQSCKCIFLTWCRQNQALSQFKFSGWYFTL